MFLNSTIFYYFIFNFRLCYTYAITRIVDTRLSNLSAVSAFVGIRYKGHPISITSLLSSCSTLFFFIQHLYSIAFSLSFSAYSWIYQSLPAFSCLLPIFMFSSSLKNQFFLHQDINFSLYHQ